MRPLTPTVIDFVFDFVVDDIQKVLSCSPAEAKDVLQKIVAERIDAHWTINRVIMCDETKIEKQHVIEKAQSLPKQAPAYSRNNRPVPERESPPKKTIERARAEYSNQNAWDKYPEDI